VPWELRKLGKGEGLLIKSNYFLYIFDIKNYLHRYHILILSYWYTVDLICTTHITAQNVWQSHLNMGIQMMLILVSFTPIITHPPYNRGQHEVSVNCCLNRYNIFRTVILLLTIISLLRSCILIFYFKSKVLVTGKGTD
jgi:hypothetical protein